MGHFENDEIAFDVPDDWRDESRVMFVFPEAKADVCLAKHTVDPDVSLDDYVKSFVRLMAVRLPKLRVVARGSAPVGSDAGAYVTLEWGGPNGRQRCACRLLVCGRELWALTGSTAVDKLGETMPALNRTLSSFAKR